MRAQRSLGGLLSALGIKSTSESPDIGFAFAYPVPHLIRHDFPPGCGQQSGYLDSPAAVGFHSFVRISAGAGGFHISNINMQDLAVVLAIWPTQTLLAENVTTPTVLAQSPPNNNYTTTFAVGNIAIATLGTIPVAQRYQLNALAAGHPNPNPYEWRVPRGHHLYMIAITVNTRAQMCLHGWESCPD